MEEAKIIFSLDNVDTIIQCSKDNKMSDIFQKYASKINKNIYDLLFIYEGKKINFDLCFNELSKILDKNDNTIKIFVYINENEINKEKIKDIILCNDKINNTMKEIKLQIENMLKNSSGNSMNIILNNINKQIDLINEDILINNEKISNLLSNNNYEINDNNSNNSNNKIEIELNNKLSDINNKVDSKNINNKNENSINPKLNNLYENLKSKYIIKIIFSNLDEKIKLKSIKYNKNLQNNLDITLINYKHFSKRHIIFESNGKGREYDNEDKNYNFEGEYLNGERNGKGKEYDDEGYLKFEG